MDREGKIEKQVNRNILVLTINIDKVNYANGEFMKSKVKEDKLKEDKLADLSLEIIDDLRRTVVDFLKHDKNFDLLLKSIKHPGVALKGITLILLSVHCYIIGSSCVAFGKNPMKLCNEIMPWILSNTEVITKLSINSSMKFGDEHE